MRRSAAWLYVIVSSDKQEDTLETQRAWGLDEAAKHGYHIERIFEGVGSGKSGARALLLRLIQELKDTPKAARPERILMKRLDRAGREAFDVISALKEIRDLGVMVRTQIEGDLTFAKVQDQIGPIFAVIQAGYENEVRSSRSRAGYDRKRAEGKLVGSKPPYGVIRTKDGHAAADPVCADTVRAIFAKWNAGELASDIVAFAQQTAPPKKSADGSRDFMPCWTLSYISKMAHNPVYKGVVVDEDTWDKAQHRKRAPHGPYRQGRVYPFSGLRCYCGAGLHARTNAPVSHWRLKTGEIKTYARKKSYVWYVCGSLLHGTEKRFPCFREDRIELAWIEKLRELKIEMAQPWVPSEESVNLSPQIAALETKLDGLNRKRERIHSAFEEGVYSAQMMRERLDSLVKEEAALKHSLEALRATVAKDDRRRMSWDEIVSAVSDATELYPHASRELKAKLNRAIFAKLGRPTITADYQLRF